MESKNKSRNKKRIQQATEQIVREVNRDQAKLEQQERKRDKELENLSSGIKLINERFKTQFYKVERKSKTLIQEWAEELRLKFLEENKPHLILQICTIISRAVSGMQFVSARHVERSLGEQYKDPLQRQRAISGRPESADELETKDVKEARENPKGAADYKTEEIEAIKNPIVLKQIAQVKSAHLDEMMVLLKIVSKCNRCMPAFKKALSSSDSFLETLNNTSGRQ